MLAAVSARLGQEKVREQFTAAPDAPVDAGSLSARLAAIASERRLSLLLCLGKRPRSSRELAALCGFEGGIAGEDLELLRRHGLTERNRDGVWSICCAALAASVERLVHLVLNATTTKEAT